MLTSLSLSISLSAAADEDRRLVLLQQAKTQEGCIATATALNNATTWSSPFHATHERHLQLALQECLTAADSRALDAESKTIRDVAIPPLAHGSLTSGK